MKMFVALLLTAFSSAVPADTTTPSLNELWSAERRIHDRINAARREHNLQPLLWHARIGTVARTHSDDMAEHEYFRHEDVRGQRVRDRTRVVGSACRRLVGENIFQITGGSGSLSDATATRVVNGWMRSPGHRRNVLRAEYKWTGVGIARTAGRTIYVTQVFCG